ncbi:hypothetical protein RND81_08G202100 [Saponaria officinalis]|uniref:Uncharacterized protein n=1 Tax=Saponaria officinalis TaxID=3572 RepID=A0AAW1JA72_SAPOF
MQGKKKTPPFKPINLTLMLLQLLITLTQSIHLLTRSTMACLNHLIDTQTTLTLDILHFYRL